MGAKLLTTKTSSGSCPDGDGNIDVARRLPERLNASRGTQGLALSSHSVFQERPKRVQILPCEHFQKASVLEARGKETQQRSLYFQ